MSRFWSEDEFVVDPTGWMTRGFLPRHVPRMPSAWPEQSQAAAYGLAPPSQPRAGVAAKAKGPDARALRNERTAPASKSKSATHYQKLLYQEFVDQGFSHEGAKTMVAQIGRETSFLPDNLFGTHGDPRNRKKNMGLISWQGARRKDLEKFLDRSGVLDKDGNMLRNDDAIRAQARYIGLELEKSAKWRNVKHILMDKTKKYSDIEAIVGDDYIVWARTNPNFGPAGYKRQNHSYDQISILKDKEHEESLSRPDVRREAPLSARAPIYPRLINRDRFGRPLRQGPAGGGGGGGW